MYSQEERNIHTLEDILRSYMIEFKVSWVEHLPLIEFAYNNSKYSSIWMAPFEVLNDIRYRSSIFWYEVGET